MNLSIASVLKNVLYLFMIIMQVATIACYGEWPKYCHLLAKWVHQYFKAYKMKLVIAAKTSIATSLNKFH